MGPNETPVRYYDRRAAADLSETSVDTIKRREKTGLLPNARPRPGDPTGAIEYPISDLINVGLYSPPANGTAPDHVLRQVRDDRELATLKADLLRAEARLDANEQLISSLQTQNKQLLKTVADLTAAIARGVADGPPTSRHPQAARRQPLPGKPPHRARLGQAPHHHLPEPRLGTHLARRRHRRVAGGSAPT